MVIAQPALREGISELFQQGIDVAKTGGNIGEWARGSHNVRYGLVGDRQYGVR